jgi:hypothetical protein
VRDERTLAAAARVAPLSPRTGETPLNSFMLVFRCSASKGREIIAIIEEERRGFDEMEALALASLVWRRRQQTNSKIDTRQHLELRKQISVSCHRLPFLCADGVWRTLDPTTGTWASDSC